MSTELQQQDAGAKLVAYARGLAVEIAKHPAIAGALSTADNAKGMVVADENANVAANDVGATIAKAMRELKKAADEVKAHPKAMIAAIDEVVKPLSARLDEGRKAVDAAQLRWQAFQRAEAAKAEAERQRKIREAEAVAEAERKRREAEAQAAALEGREPEPIVEEDIPPPVVPEQIVAPPALVRTSAGHSTTVKRLTCELKNPAECDPFWLKLDSTKGPLAAFEPRMERGDVARPGVGRENGVEYRGCLFFYNETIQRGAAR